MIRDDLSNYIDKNYSKLLKAARFITRDNTAQDLLHDVLIYILTRKTYSQKVVDCTNYYNYIFKALLVQYISKTSPYNKTYKRYVKIEEIEMVDDAKQCDYTYDEIIEWVSKSDLFNSKIKNYLTKTIFFDYYAPTFIIQISGMTALEVKEINKTSHLKIATKYDISKSSVRNACQDVLKKIKEKWDEKDT